jgi:hypothetical protein
MAVTESGLVKRRPCIPSKRAGKVYAIFTVRNEGSPSADAAELDATLHSLQFLP